MTSIPALSDALKRVGLLASDKTRPVKVDFTDNMLVETHPRFASPSSLGVWVMVSEVMFAELTELMFAELVDLARFRHRSHQVHAHWQVADLPRGLIELDIDHQRQTEQAP